MIEAFSSTSRYLDDLLNIDNIYFDGMVIKICPSELKFIHNTNIRLIEAFNEHANVTSIFIIQTIHNTINNHSFLNKHLLNLPNNKIQCGLTSGDALYQFYMQNSM